MNITKDDVGAFQQNHEKVLHTQKKFNAVQNFCSALSLSLSLSLTLSPTLTRNAKNLFTFYALL